MLFQRQRKMRLGSFIHSKIVERNIRQIYMNIFIITGVYTKFIHFTSYTREFNV